MRLSLLIPAHDLQMISFSLAVDLTEFDRGNLEDIARMGALASIAKARRALDEIEAVLRDEPVKVGPRSLRVVS